MRVFVAPDSFGSTLSAAQAADAIARGWLKIRKSDEVIIAPQSDGGPGFVEVLAQSGGQILSHKVRGPLGDDISAQWLWFPENKEAYIESSLACGLQLIPGGVNTYSAINASTYGVGQLTRHACQQGAKVITIGLGGSATSDGGRGFIEAIAGVPPATIATDYQLSRDVIDKARIVTRGVQLIAATDVDNPLLGISGAVHFFGPQKGARGGVLIELEKRNKQWSKILGTSDSCEEIANCPGAGAAGGLGAAIFALAGSRCSGSEVIDVATKRTEKIMNADLVITGEGKLDHQSVHGKVAWAVAATAQKYHVPVVIIAGQVVLDAEKLCAGGIIRAYSLTEHAGSILRAMSEASWICFSLAQRVARDWNKGYVFPGN